MTTSQILQALQTLKPSEQLIVAETALNLVQVQQESLTIEERQRQLAVAATLAIADYKTDAELTVFTDLDSEDFYEYTGEDLEQSIDFLA